MTSLWLTLVLLATPPVAPVAPGGPVDLDDPTGQALAPFHASLRRTAVGIEKTRVLFFGASHTAADLLTGRLRERLQGRFGDGGHGFFMPAKPWRSYRKQHLVFDAPKRDSHRWEWEFVRIKGEPRPDGLYGLAGMAVTATKKEQWSKFHTATDGGIGTRAGLLELWYDRQPSGGDLTITIKGQKKQRLKTKGVRGLGVFEAGFLDRPQSFALLPKGNGPVRIYGAILERSRAGVVLDNLGINGAKAASQLFWNESLWHTLVQRRKPALVVLAYGTNESSDEQQTIPEYELDLRRVLARVRRAAPAASCVLVGPSDHPLSPSDRKERRDPEGELRFRHRVRTQHVIDTQRRVSREYGCGFFDTVAATGGRFSIVSWVDSEPQLAWHDYVHFTPLGYSVLGDRLHDALMAGFDR